MSEAGRQHIDLAKQHADVVIACLNAIIAYAEWAPVPDLARYGILSGYSLVDTLAEIAISILPVHCFLLMRTRKLIIGAASYFLLLTSVFMLVRFSKSFARGMQLGCLI